MPEFIRTFQVGRMNKNLDERLVPNGEYRDALNLDLSNSESDNVGSLQSVKGTLQRASDWGDDYISAYSNAVCVGSIVDTENDKIYWLVTSDHYDCIAEFDDKSKEIEPVLVAPSGGILNFDPDRLITGINLLEGFLLFTDNYNEPKNVRIAKFKAGSTDFITPTLLPDYNANTGDYAYNSSNQQVTEEYITVIKRGPGNAPGLDMSDSEFGSDIVGAGVNPAIASVDDTNGYQDFTYQPDPINNPSERLPLPTYAEYLEHVANNPPPAYSGTSIEGWDGIAEFEVSNTLPANIWTFGSKVVLTADIVDDQNQVFDYGVRVSIESVVGTTVRAKIEAVSEDIKIFTDPILWDAVLEEKSPMFEYKFPRFAYRWKFEDSQYSVFSPFTTVAFIGDNFEYVASDGYNLGMANNIRKLIINSLDWGNDSVTEIDILYKESNNNVIYRVDTLKRAEGEVSEYEIKSELISSVIESNQILRPWDNVPRQAQAQELIGNRIVYANYLQNYNVDKSPKVEINIGSQLHGEIGAPEPSIKSIRNYQLGVVYGDTYGRETPVFSNDDATTDLAVSHAQDKNFISAKAIGTAPDWAEYFKFFIKETSNEYYNLALDRFYFAEDGNVWLSFPSSDRNKVDEETYLILKKRHSTLVAVPNLVRYKILAIENNVPEFIKTFKRSVTGSEVDIDSGFEENSLVLEFDGPSEGQFSAAVNAENYVEIVKDGLSTNKYRIESGGRTGTGDKYVIKLEIPLGDEAFFLDSLSPGTNVQINLFKDQTENKEEFEGRFFVKINRDFEFDQNILNPSQENEARYGSLGKIEMDGFTCPNDPFGDSGKWGIYYRDNGSERRGSNVPLEGLGAWGNIHPSNALIFKNHYNPPTRNNYWFGFQRDGVGNGQDYGPVLGRIIADQIQDGYLQVGKYLRFINGATGEPSENVYEIKEVHVDYRRRGTGSVAQRKKGYYRNIYLVKLDRPIDEDIVPQFAGDYSQTPNFEVLDKVIADNNKLFSTTDPAIFETEPKEDIGLDIYYEASNAFPIAEYNDEKILDWFNCYSYGQGVESNRIRDDFNAVTIDKGVKASTVLDEPYAEERRKSDFIFSQIFNSNSGVNRLNQFIQALPITKSINPIYGSIQKLHARNTDLIALAEDKCFRVLANKDALFNADGNTNVTSNNNVLGQAVPYAGEFGISTNPESFASYGYRAYFTDKRRGAVIRLSMDGITLISSKGMSDFFEDNLHVNSKLIGSYDEDKGIYNLTLGDLSNEWELKLSPDKDYHLSEDCNATTRDLELSTTVAFKESVDGWTSRKSFIPEDGVSLNSKYYTFKQGLLWEHNATDQYNSFYGVQYDSAFNMLFNESFNSVKGYSTVNYNGTKSRRFEYEHNSKWYSLAEINALAVTPTDVREKNPGWYVNYIKTNLEGGEVKEFLDKEGKWFNYIKGVNIFEECDKERDGGGIGSPSNIIHDAQTFNLTITLNTTGDCS